jgi:hypothetical protein
VRCWRSHPTYYAAYKLSLEAEEQQRKAREQLKSQSK